MFKAIILLTRAEGTSREELRSWWLERHAPLARQLPGLRRLVFNVVGGHEVPYDGVSELWFDGRENFDAAYASAIGKQVAADSLANVSARVRLFVDEQPQLGWTPCRNREEMSIAAPTSRKRTPTAGERFLVYGVAGWAIDSLYVWLQTGQRRPSSLLNVPVYGLAQPLFEPLHDRIRHRPLAFRAMAYGVGILGVEYASGRLLRRLFGSAPWDYGEARLGIGGLVRLDYLPVWAAFGLGLEHLHDALSGEAAD